MVARPLRVDSADARHNGSTEEVAVVSKFKQEYVFLRFSSSVGKHKQARRKRETKERRTRRVSLAQGKERAKNTSSLVHYRKSQTPLKHIHTHLLTSVLYAVVIYTSGPQFGIRDSGTWMRVSTNQGEFNRQQIIEKKNLQKNNKLMQRLVTGFWNKIVFDVERLRWFPYQNFLNTATWRAKDFL